MAENNVFHSIFSTPREKTEEEKEEEDKKKMEKLNPFLEKNTGEGPRDKDIGYSLNPSSAGYNGWKGALNLSIESFGESPEKHYYYFIKFFEANAEAFYGIKARKIYKLKDVFDASVSSSFHGQIGTKMSAIQGQVANYLSQIGQLTKTLLPMIRELRMMDERMEYYRNSLSEKPGDEPARQNEVTLKSTWIEVVEQGMQNPNSVYSMSTKLGFVTLPDLFFATNPHGKTPEKQMENLHKALGQMEKQHSFNKKLRLALEKKLVQYYTWKKKTHREMQHTYKFRLKNFKQHYNVIKLYTSWVKPYLTTLKALQMKNDPSSHDLVGSFETSRLDLELLVDIGKKGRWHSCIMVRLKYTTRPDLHYTSGGQRQPIHSGLIKISIEPYVATQDDIDWYKDKTDKDILANASGSEIDFSKSIDNMLDGLGDDIQDYLREAETGKKKEDEKKKGEKPEHPYLDPFSSLLGSFRIFVPRMGKDGKRRKSKGELESEAREDMAAKKSMAGLAATFAWISYDVFKSQNGMMTPL
jgi:hypothetical protein